VRATVADFAAVGRFLRERSGVHLGEDKGYLVRSLLAPLVQRHGGGSLGALMDRVAREPDGEIATEVVEALLNHETWFFRDHHVFEVLRATVLPALQASPRRPLRIWSAACASGQEPYSIAMLVETFFPRLAEDVEIWATDLSGRMLERCQQGRYSQLEVNRGLPAPMLVRHFEEEDGQWRVSARLRGRVQAGPIDLSRPWEGLPEMDIVFLRNVLIYFENPLREEVLQRVHRQLRPDGYLFLGSAEATFTRHECFEAERVGKAGFHRARALEVRR